jgi:UDP-N-acetylglucosamine acyltransferase
MIHPTAVIHPEAKLAPSVEVGPYAIIDAGVEIGPDCVVGPHVLLTGQTKIGAGNRFHAGCVIGDAPQDLKYHGAPTRLIIGDQNVFREHVTVNRATNLEEATVVGSNGFFMASAHIGHNCVVGNHVIMANGTMLGGHATVQDRAFISGCCLVHQFCRVGTLAIMRGGSAISKDLPPFTVACDQNHICGLNVVGLRRAGYPAEARLELKRLYHALFRGGRNLTEAAALARKSFSTPAARVMLEFIVGARRGVCGDRGQARGGEE